MAREDFDLEGVNTPRRRKTLTMRWLRSRHRKWAADGESLKVWAKRDSAKERVREADRFPNGLSPKVAELIGVR
jgi:hypothetical protein